MSVLQIHQNVNKNYNLLKNGKIIDIVFKKEILINEITIFGIEKIGKCGLFC